MHCTTTVDASKCLRVRILFPRANGCPTTVQSSSYKKLLAKLLFRINELPSFGVFTIDFASGRLAYQQSILLSA